MSAPNEIANASRQHSQTGILANARNTIITGGQFKLNVKSETTQALDGFQLLLENVATAAFHDSAQRVDPPRCHENTRQAVLQEIFIWIEDKDNSRTKRMVWLNGAAGAGKSAICQTVAEMCMAKGMLVASFFFFRTDPTRNTINPVVSTLAYQIIRLVPETKSKIVKAIQKNPLVFQQAFESQLDQLIVRPLQAISKVRSDFKVVLIIDGLDECNRLDNQRNIITGLGKLFKSNGVPIIVLFGSRQEVQIQATFDSPEVSKFLLRLPLDAHYLPDNDIRFFLNEGFRSIHETHPFRQHLDSNWPESALVEEIVEKSSGQFIYASVVMRFVSSPRSSPMSQLEIVRGLRPIQSVTPFAQLDALYRHIFSRVEDLYNAKIILTYCIIGQGTYLGFVSQDTGLSRAEIAIALVDLISVITCEGDYLRFLHASLCDFLIDDTRSLEYSISNPIWSTRVAILWHRSVKGGNLSNSIVINEFLKHAKPTPELKECISSFNPSAFSISGVPHHLVPYLKCVHNLNFEDNADFFSSHLERVLNHMHDSQKLDLMSGSDLHKFVSDYKTSHNQAIPSDRQMKWRKRFKKWFLNICNFWPLNQNCTRNK